MDDGSTDDSYEVLCRVHRSDARFKCLRLARNFGSHLAITAGLQHARGDVAIITTADLEEPPELIPDLLSKWREGCHIVWGIREERTDRRPNRMAATLYHRLFRRLAMPAYGGEEIGGGFVLLDCKVIDVVNRFGERNRNLIGLLLWSGFRQGRVHYRPEKRQTGHSRWTLSKKVNLALDSFVGFSSRPLRLALGVGVTLFLVGLVGLLAVIGAGLLTGEGTSTGWLLLVIGLLVSGIQLGATGLLGEYVWRALDEARARPLYVVMDRLGLDEPEGADGD